MKSIMQLALGADWNRLPPALQAHYRFGRTIDRGHLDIAYPRFMQPCLSLLRCLGILVNRRGAAIPTVVCKQVENDRQHWQRTLRYGDGHALTFNTQWAWAGGNQPMRNGRSSGIGNTIENIRFGFKVAILLFPEG